MRPPQLRGDVGLTLGTVTAHHGLLRLRNEPVTDGADLAGNDRLCLVPSVLFPLCDGCVRGADATDTTVHFAGNRADRHVMVKVEAVAAGYGYCFGSGRRLYILFVC